VVRLAQGPLMMEAGDPSLHLFFFLELGPWDQAGLIGEPAPCRPRQARRGWRSKPVPTLPPAGRKDRADLSASDTTALGIQP
jgi:hypothetical protein